MNQFCQRNQVGFIVANVGFVHQGQLVFVGQNDSTTTDAWLVQPSMDCLRQFVDFPDVTERQSVFSSGQGEFGGFVKSSKLTSLEPSAMLRSSRNGDDTPKRLATNIVLRTPAFSIT